MSLRTGFDRKVNQKASTYLMSKSTHFRTWQTAAPFAIAAALMAGQASPAIARAAAFDVLYSFTGVSSGYTPYSGLAADQAGNLYGTTLYGGTSDVGVVFKVTPSGSETVLHSFGGGQDGAWPVTGLIQDQAGNFYGTTSGGGSANCAYGSGCGTVYKLAPDGTETVLYAFTGGNDGNYPYAGLVIDKKGNLYGTTVYGGTDGNGVVFELAPNGIETVLHSFTGGNDGANPYCDLIRDKAGNLYCTASEGGAGGAGVVFQLTPNGTFNVLHAFTGGSDGAYPLAGVIQDKSGNLYTTASSGGIVNCAYETGCGTVVKIAAGGTFSVLYSFTGGNDGSSPESDLIADGTGNLYGTTYYGGGNGLEGVVFKLAPDGTETVLHNFTGGEDGGSTSAGLIKDKGQAGGYLYGTASLGGADQYGVVFKVKK